MKKIFIGTGSGSEHKICAYQSTVVYEFFKQNGYSIQKWPNWADIIVINGYPFEEFEEKINLLTINYYLRKYPKADLLVIGSIPAMMPYLSRIKRISMIGWREYEKFDEVFKHSVSIKDIQVDNIKYFAPLNLENLTIDKFWYPWKNIESKRVFSPSDYTISIQDIEDETYEIESIKEYDFESYNYLEDLSGEYPIETSTGCGWNCSYCDIRTISGFVKSKPLEKILEKIKRGLHLWYKEFHLIDEDSWSYGLDIWMDFSHLLNAINSLDGDFKVRIFYFEPGRLERLFDKIEPEVWKKIVWVCIPLQTTSQRILTLMNRHYNIPKVLEICGKIKNIHPDIDLSTQFIYGFPTETFEEFKDYFRLVKVFDEIWFYYYSDRKGTKSLHFDWKIPKEELAKRMIFLWKFKEIYRKKVFDKNLSLAIGLSIIRARNK